MQQLSIEHGDNGSQTPVWGSIRNNRSPGNRENTERRTGPLSLKTSHYVAAAIDMDDFAGDVIVFNQEDHGTDNVFHAAGTFQ